MGAEGRWATVALVITGALILQQSAFVAAQSTYTVGDNNGWTFPPNGVATYYDDWAKQHAFYAGDSLFFNYESTLHNVVEVTKADFSSCSSASPIATYNQANATVTLDRTGYYAFICGLPAHCAGNMKIQLNVLAVGTPANSPVPPETSPAASGPGAAAAAGPGPSGGPSSSAGYSTRSLVSAKMIIFPVLFAAAAALFL